MRRHVFGLVIGTLALSTVAGAHEFTREGVTVAHPWVRATPAGVNVGGAYLQIKAAAGKDDRLIGARSPSAGSAEIHNHIMEGGIARMRRVDAVAVAGGKSLVLAPSGYHVMLMDLKQPLREGDLVKLTLLFEKAGEIEVDATVEPVGAMGPHGFYHQPDVDKGTGSARHKH